MAGVTTDTPDTALQIVPAIMGEQVHRKLVEIRGVRRIGDIARTGEDRKLLLPSTWQHQRATLSIAERVARCLERLAYLIGAYILLSTTQFLVLLHTSHDLSREGR